jgi:hypothetical protein
MGYYHLPTSTERSPRGLETKLSDGALLGAPDTGWTPELAALCGFVQIATVARPADTPTTTHTRSVALVAGTPTEVWTARPKTAAELLADAATATQTTIETQARAAFTANRAYLAIGAPTNAQNLAQIRAITRQMQAMIRLVVARDLLGTDTTID